MSVPIALERSERRAKRCSRSLAAYARRNAHTASCREKTQKRPGGRTRARGPTCNDARSAEPRSAPSRAGALPPRRPSGRRVHRGDGHGQPSMSAVAAIHRESPHSAGRWKDPATACTIRGPRRDEANRRAEDRLRRATLCTPSFGERLSSPRKKNAVIAPGIDAETLLRLSDANRSHGAAARVPPNHREEREYRIGYPP